MRPLKQQAHRQKQNAPRAFILSLTTKFKPPLPSVKKPPTRLEEIGIHKVADLLSADAKELSEQLETKWIRETIVKDWQDQARLVCEVAGLRGGHAQILVAASIKTSRSLAKMSGGELYSMMSLYCQTKEGLNLRACENLPDQQKVEAWIKAVIDHPRSVAA